jgi:hypothetical protein
MEEIILFIKENNPDLYTEHEKDFGRLQKKSFKKYEKQK